VLYGLRGPGPAEPAGAREGGGSMENKTHICKRCRDRVPDETTFWIGGEAFCQRCGPAVYALKLAGWTQAHATNGPPPDPNKPVFNLGPTDMAD
jgi:hypothetical protein